MLIIAIITANNAIQSPNDKNFWLGSACASLLIAFLALLVKAFSNRD